MTAEHVRSCVAVTAGYGGENCHLQYSACVSSPCINGGTCYDDESPDTFRCHCRHGFTGTHCSIQVTITVMFYPDTFRCHCRQGFTGTRCSIQVAITVLS